MRKKVFTILIYLTTQLLYGSDLIQDFNGNTHIPSNQTLSSWHQRDISITVDIPFSERHLVSTVWPSVRKEPIQNPSVVLVFYSDMTFEYGSFQNGQAVYGKYELAGNTVILFEYDYNSFSFFNQGDNSILKPFLDKDKVNLTLSEVKSFYYIYSLISDDLSLQVYAAGLRPEPGDVVSGYGIEFIAQDFECTVTTRSNVYLSPTLTDSSVYDRKFNNDVFDENGNHGTVTRNRMEQAHIAQGDKIWVFGESSENQSLLCYAAVSNEGYSRGFFWVPDDAISDCSER